MNPQNARLLNTVAPHDGVGLVAEETEPHAPGRGPAGGDSRLRVQGKFLYLGDRKFWIRGVTYGTFRPREDGADYPAPEVVERDFAAMAAGGLNSVRTYTVPPREILDCAQRHGLRVMVGLPWEQHLAFLDEKGRAAIIEERVREGVRSCAGHPAILCFSVGNEIPASIVRWHGRKRIEKFIERLFGIVKAEDPEALVTYVNFPTTEYLRLPFLDLVCFNVYLENQADLKAYLARLQNLSGEKPLMMAEIGLDTRRNGEQAQAWSLEWQIRTAFAAGCAGAFVFSWTDEWYRGGAEIEDWDFGVTTREREPKPALRNVGRAFADAPFSMEMTWPRVSVVICTYNGHRTIRDTLEHLERVDYPDFEVIVVNDGSTDAAAEIAMGFDVRLITTENRGLSAARNTGWREATGEIVAYIDDDAYPDPHWLKYLAATFESTTHAAVGGPNLAPPGDGPIADCVANAPGGPVQVLISDQTADHIPGCNMAFRRSVLEAVGGFDEQFRIAGDDVDICWRVQERGWTIGFHASAVVWHHRRNSVLTYWKQQKNYGRAEAMLERTWPQKYNSAGHISWNGRLYGRGVTLPLAKTKSRVYGGVWGTAPFQSLYRSPPGTLLALPLMPEWYLLVAFLGMLSAFGTIWRPLLFALPLLGLALAAPAVQAVRSARRATFHPTPTRRWSRFKRRALTAFLHAIHPVGRLLGRLSHGLTPWRQRGLGGFVLPWKRVENLWSEHWKGPEQWLASIENTLQRRGAPFRRGGNFDSWDLEVRGGILGAARTVLVIEEHGGGRQMIRFRAWPKYFTGVVGLSLVLGALASWAALATAWIAAVALGAAALLLLLRMFYECALSTATLLDGIEQERKNISDEEA